MKVLLSFILGAALTAYTALNIQQGAEPWAPKIMNMCFSPSNHDVSGNLRVAYTGLSPTLDRLICFYVNFTQQPLHDLLGAPLMRLMMGAFGAAYGIMALEAQRKGFKRSTLLISFPLLGLLANFVGIFSVWSLLWVPMALYYKSNKKDTADWSITTSDAYGTMAAIVAGFYLPSLILASPLIPNDSKIEQDLVSIWIVLPVIIVPLMGLCGKFVKSAGSSIEKIRDPALKERLYVAEGKDSLERSLLFLGVLNMFNYFVNFWIVGNKGIRVWDSIMLLLNAPGNLPADLTFGDLGQLLSTRTLLVDYIALSAGFILWALFDGGIFSALFVVVIMPIVGPGAAVCYYAYTRENKLQNLASADRETDKAITAAVNDKKDGQKTK